MKWILGSVYFCVKGFGWRAAAGVLCGCFATIAIACNTAAQPPWATAQATQPPASVLQRGRTMIDAKPMALGELVESADRIFVGTIEKITATTSRLTQAGRSADASIRIVQIRIDRPLKGPLEAGQRLEVRQLVSLSAPLNAGETVMWFLPADSALGLTQPLGIYSGDFRINMNDPVRPAVNLRQNEGLWRDAPAAATGVPLDLLVSATLSRVKRQVFP